MDISKKYIKMCEEAKIIQKNKRWYDIGDYCYGIRFKTTQKYNTSQKSIYQYDPVFNKEWKDNVSKSFHKIYNIWLPSQDQLQAMISIPPSLISKFKKFLESYHFHCVFNSMEQLWLAYVMEEKYQKLWNYRNKKWSKSRRK